MQKYQQLSDLLAGAQEDAQKFYNKGNAAAGSRLRKTMQNIKVLAQEVRTEVSALKKSKTN